MPVHFASRALDGVSSAKLAYGALAAVTAYGIKVISGGRKSIWEREWAGKLIMIVAPPEPTTFSLIHHLLHLPSPPQILYLPPLPSPLPASLVTLLHTIKIAATNPAAQLHCEPLPPTVEGVRMFVRKWAAAPRGTTGEEGRRVDAIVLGGAWECEQAPAFAGSGEGEREELLAKVLEGGDGEGESKGEEGARWTAHQHHFHFITSLLPSLLKAPAERDIRIINLVSPAWPAAVPRLEKQLKDGPVGVDGDVASTPAAEGLALGSTAQGMLERAGADGLTTFFMFQHFRLILDALASASYGQREVVPDPNAPLGAGEGGKKAGGAKEVKKVDVTSNIKALAVVMPWARDEVVRPLVSARVVLGGLLWLLLYPLVLIFTPSPSMAVQSVLYALSAPVLYDGDDGKTEGGEGKKGEAKGAEKPGESKRTAAGKNDLDARRSGVRQGDVVRDCAVIDLPPVLHNRAIARGTYDRIEAEVETGVREYEAAEKKKAENQPKRDTKVKFADDSAAQ